MFELKPETYQANKNLYILLLVLLSVLAGAILFLSLPWGVGIAPDSAKYIKAADKFSTTFSWDVFSSSWPPLYALILAGVNLLFNKILFSALVLQAILFSLNTALFIVFIDRCLIFIGKLRGYFTLLAGLFFVFNYPVFYLHQYALTEALFLTFFLSSYIFALRFLEISSYKYLILSAILTGLMVVTRYAAVAFVIATPLFFLVLNCNYKNVKKQFFDVIIFVFIAVLPISGWVGFNILSSGDGSGRVIAYHPITLKHVFDFKDVFLIWFAVPYFSGFLIFFSIIIQVYIFFIKAEGIKTKRLVLALNFSAIFYIIFIAFSISFIDAYTPVDPRILVPVWVLFFLSVFVSLSELIKNRIVFYLGLSVLTLVFGANLINTLNVIENSVSKGIGFMQKNSASSPLFRLILEDVDNLEVYSNAPDYIYFFTGRETKSLPPIYAATSKIQNPHYMSEMLEIVEKIDQKKAVIVYFKKFHWRAYFPLPDEFEEFFSLYSNYKYADGYYFDRWEDPALKLDTGTSVILER